MLSVEMDFENLKCWDSLKGEDLIGLSSKNQSQSSFPDRPKVQYLPMDRAMLSVHPVTC